MLEMTGSQLELFSEVLRKAFTPTELRRLLEYRLERSLDDLSLAPDYQQIVFDVIAASRRQGWTDRLLLAERWLQAHRQTAGLRVGYFGASTGAGAALQAAAREPQAVGAIVSRGGERFQVLPPTIREVNPVGSGDALVAGFAIGLAEGTSLQDMARVACAMGTANAMSWDIGHFTRDEVERIVSSVSVRDCETQS